MLVDDVTPVINELQSLALHMLQIIDFIDVLFCHEDNYCCYVYLLIYSIHVRECIIYFTKIKIIMTSL